MFKYVIQRRGDGKCSYGRVLHITRKGNYAVQFLNFMGEFICDIHGKPMYEVVKRNQIQIVSKLVWERLYKAATKK